jgi:urea carboxylase
MPIYDPSQQTSYLKDFMCLFNPGDIVKWKPIGRDEYDQTVADVEANKYTPLIRDVEFSLADFQSDIDGYNKKLMEALHA